MLCDYNITNSFETKYQQFRVGLFINKYYLATGSLSHLAWRRLLKNRMAVVSMAFILLTIFVSILGYLITPDKTPYANDQNLVLTTKKPGFKVMMLSVRKNELANRHNLLSFIMFGGKSGYLRIPITGYSFTDSTIVVNEYQGEGITGKQTVYSLADVVYPVEEKIRFDDSTGRFTFTTVDGEKLTLGAAEVKAKILKHNLAIKKIILGTDRFGRDVLSQLMIGARLSLSVGCISVLISLLVGIFMGAIAGYFGGLTDSVITWFINVIWSVPTLLLVIVITFTLGKGFWQVFIAVGLTMWVEVARVVRGQFISLREKEFVEAGKALGFSNARIIFRHILPNSMAPVIVISAANFASAILLESGLSFLGIGVQPPMPSWGTMIRENYAYIILDYAYLAILPGIAIMAMVLAFMLLGNALRDALDVKTTG
jgi:peptide/nickel transport system permease protein